MKVFLSWSGSRSKELAEGLRDWRKPVIQSLNPWMSSEDIEKGAVWETEILGNLVDAKAGIICVTPENQSATWLNFEAGALAKTVTKSMVCTYLLGLNPADVKGPLSRFQHTIANKQDTRRLLHTLNNALDGQALAEGVINDAFDMGWPRLEARLDAINSAVSPKVSPRTSEDLLEEILLLARDQGKQTAEILSSLYSIPKVPLNATWNSGLSPLWRSPDYREPQSQFISSTDDDSLKGEPQVGYVSAIETAERVTNDAQSKSGDPL
jgi:hypothetical protein